MSFCGTAMAVMAGRDRLAGVRAVPDNLLKQLAPRGRLVAVVDETLMTFDKARTKITKNSIFPMTLPMMETGKSKSL